MSMHHIMWPLLRVIGMLNKDAAVHVLAPMLDKIAFAMLAEAAGFDVTRGEAFWRHAAALGYWNICTYAPEFDVDAQFAMGEGAAIYGDVDRVRKYVAEHHFTAIFRSVGHVMHTRVYDHLCRWLRERKCRIDHDNRYHCIDCAFMDYNFRYDILKNRIIAGHPITDALDWPHARRYPELLSLFDLAIQHNTWKQFIRWVAMFAGTYDSTPFKIAIAHVITLDRDDIICFAHACTKYTADYLSRYGGKIGPKVRSFVDMYAKHIISN